MFAGLVVGRIVLAVALDQCVEGRALRVMRHDERADLGAQEVIGARGAERRQLFQLLGIHEFHHLARIDEVSDLHFVFRDAAANLGQQAARHLAPLRLRQALDLLALEGGLLAVALKPDGGLVDDAQRRVVAGPGVIGPGEEAVAAQHHADIFGMRLGHVAKLDAEVDAGALPGQVAHLAAEDLLGQALRVLRGGNGDDRVGMDVIDVGIGHVAMQAGVDRGRAGVEIVDAVVQRVHHRVFLIEALVEPLQGFELVHVERGEAVELHRADVAAGALDPQDGDVAAGQRILHLHLCRGIAAAEIGDAQVGAEEI